MSKTAEELLSAMQAGTGSEEEIMESLRLAKALDAAAEGTATDEQVSLLKAVGVVSDNDDDDDDSDDDDEDAAGSDDDGEDESDGEDDDDEKEKPVKKAIDAELPPGESFSQFVDAQIAQAGETGAIDATPVLIGLGQQLERVTKALSIMGDLMDEQAATIADLQSEQRKTRQSLAPLAKALEAGTLSSLPSADVESVGDKQAVILKAIQESVGGQLAQALTRVAQLEDAVSRHPASPHPAAVPMQKGLPVGYNGDVDYTAAIGMIQKHATLDRMEKAEALACMDEARRSGQPLVAVLKAFGVG